MIRIGKEVNFIQFEANKYPIRKTIEKHPNKNPQNKLQLINENFHKITYIMTKIPYKLSIFFITFKMIKLVIIINNQSC